MKTSLKLTFCISLSMWVSLVALGAGQVKVPIPKPEQLAWQDAELTAVFHYDLHVFDRSLYQQHQNRTVPIQDYNIFNSEKYDVDQWITSVKAAGVKIAILTATHETGFANYQSDVNPYCMKALKWRDGKGDVFRDFVNACRRHGIRPGVYIGIRWNSFLGIYDFRTPNDGSQFQKNRRVYYNRMCEGMTRELMSRYGDLAIVWYDGGGCGPDLGGPDLLPIIEKYQKHIIFYHNTQRADIRWGGSERGIVDYPCWGTYPFPFSHSKSLRKITKNNFELLRHGDPDGAYYMPAMSDAPLRGYRGRHEWFWEPGDEGHIFPLKNLMNMYKNSVGRNSTLILGVTPDDRGLLPDADVKRLAEWGREIKRVYGSPFAEKESIGDQTTFTFNQPQTISHVVIEEEIAKGERVREYEIEALIEGKWQSLCKGSCIGHKRIEWLKKPVKVSGLRFAVKKAVGKASIKRIALFSTR